MSVMFLYLLKSATDTISKSWSEADPVNIKRTIKKEASYGHLRRCKPILVSLRRTNLIESFPLIYTFKKFVEKFLISFLSVKYINNL